MNVPTVFLIYSVVDDLCTVGKLGTNNSNDTLRENDGCEGVRPGSHIFSDPKGFDLRSLVDVRILRSFYLVENIVPVKLKIRLPETNRC